MLHPSLLRCAITACLLFVISAAGLLPGAAPARAAAPARLFAIPSPLTPTPACTQADPCSLQAAVNKAAAGDTIYASGGTYASSAAQVLNLDKSVIIRGGWDGQNGLMIEIDPLQYPTILDGGGARVVIHISAGVSSTLIDLVIQNGWGDFKGGGILVDAGASGGTVVIGCLFQNNHATSYGGAIYLSEGMLTVTDSAFHNNTAVYGGGAVMTSPNTLFIVERAIAADNTASYGSFIHTSGGSFAMRGSYLTGHGGGSGVIAMDSNGTNYLTLENNLFIHNTDKLFTEMGVPVALQVTIRHNTMVNNTHKGIVLTEIPTGSIQNNIFSSFGNASLDVWDGSTVSVDHNLFWANASNPDTGTDAIFQDPRLTADYHLGSGSPAIDAGVTIGGVAEDYDRDMRPMGSAPDIGADERRMYSYLPGVMKP